MLEELSQYRDTYLKNYFSIMPENAIKLSSVNGKFYGYNEGIGELEIEHKWYVNVGLAKEYGIDLDKYKPVDMSNGLMHATRYIKAKRKKKA